MTMPSDKIRANDMTLTADEAKNTVMPFGKWKGRDLGKIAEDDPLYIDWLTDAGIKNPRLLEAVMTVARLYKNEIEAACRDADE